MRSTLFTIAILLGTSSGFAQPKESDYYTITPFEFPQKQVLEIGGLEWMPDGKLAVSTRRGEIWMVKDPFAKKPVASQFSRWAHGLHEVLGLAYNKKDGFLYITQRPDVSKLKDSDGDGKADTFQVVNDEWGISGDYHEYAFGTKFDKNGDIWVTLCLTGSFSSKVPYRGWCLRVTKDGKLIPTCSGVRSPGGMGFNAAGDVFYTDNQGPWNGTSGLKHLSPGGFVGHPGGFNWYDEAIKRNPKLKKAATPKSGSRMMTEAAKIPQLVPTAILFPYRKMGQSASGITCDLTKGKFGPFTEQLFVGDQTHSTIMRVDLEKVNGRYQGACFPFLSGIGSGTLPLLMVNDKGRVAMFAGGTNRGWGSRGKKPFSLDRVEWTGKVPFEIKHMKVQKDGFELTFTKPVNAESASITDNYKMKTYTYIYQASYGSPEVDHTTPKIKAAEVSKDGLKVKLVIDGLKIGHVHELKCEVKSEKGTGLLHKDAYYTLNYLPK